MPPRPVVRSAAPVCMLRAGRGLRAAALACGALIAAVPAPVRASEPREPPNAPLTPDIDADQFLSRAARLSSDAARGRESGTPEGRETEEQVAAEFARFGLEPLGADGGPFQPVPLPGRPFLADACHLDVRGGGADPLRTGPGSGSVPFSFSAAGAVEGGVVFAGYGLTADDGSYDDWAGIDVTGRIALVLRHGPREDKPDSPWSLRGKNVAAMSFSAKAKRAAERGAAALLVVNDHHHGDAAMPTQLPGESATIPVVAVSRSTANRILRGIGKEVRDLERGIERDLTPRSSAVTGVTVSLRVSFGAAEARNVLFVRRGSDPSLREEAIVVGAHIDHVGLGWFGSPAGPGQIHNGADDNASGMAALLEVAEALAAGPAMKRSVVFAGWCGEEKGLVGSDHFCKKPTWDLAKVALCVNLDMVGRYRDDDDHGGLLVCGAPTGTGLEDAVARAAKANDLRATASWEAWEQSDHFSFYRRKVPSLFLHTGLHPDYHRPGDDWWKLDGRNGARIARTTVDLVRELADAPTRPEFREKPKRPVIGVNLGDADDDAGAVVTTVFPGMGASEAGLRPKDVVVEFAGARVTSAGDLLRALANQAVGSDVAVVYRRDGEEKRTQIRISGR